MVEITVNERCFDVDKQWEDAEVRLSLAAEEVILRFLYLESDARLIKGLRKFVCRIQYHSLLVCANIQIFAEFLPGKSGELAF